VFSCFVVTRAWYDYKISMRRLNAIKRLGMKLKRFY